MKDNLKIGVLAHSYLTEIELLHKISWFVNVFRDEMDKEGWDIVYGSLNAMDINFKILINKKNKTITKKLAYQYAADYGWIVKSNTGCVTGYDIDKLTRNKHLLTGNELGLL
jgi:hypothetical protein